MKNKTYQYQGIKIHYSLGYYYPECNSNYESKDLLDVKDYLRRCYIPAMEGINRILGLSLRSFI